MIDRKDRVAAVLAGREHLVEIFVSASPAFAMLRDPLARRTMARMVTVEQAARIAGIDAAALVGALNAALGASGAPAASPPAPAPEAAADAAPAGLLETPADRLKVLDVREDLRAGREPLRRILDAVRGLSADQVLQLRATFEPVPLYAVLEKQGLAHFTERLAADDWRIWFYRSRAPVAPRAPREAAPTGGGDVPAGDDVVVLDVRGLEPPEPMARTLAALAALPRGATLVQLNVRVPQFLLPRLEERGFEYELREQSAELVRIFIRHRRP